MPSVARGGLRGRGASGSARVCAVESVVLQWVQIPPGNWVAPAGSYRSEGGGNEATGAFETDGSLGDSANRRAVTRVNVEQASKRPMCTPTSHSEGEGRRRWGNGQ